MSVTPDRQDDLADEVFGDPPPDSQDVDRRDAPAPGLQRAVRNAVLIPLVLVALLFIVSLFRGGGDDPPPQERPLDPAAVEAAATPSLPTRPQSSAAPTEAAPSPSPSASPTTYSVAIPAGGRACPTTEGKGDYGRSASGNSRTSCPFSEAVRRAYVDSGAAGTAVDVTAFSPVTNKAYDLKCQGEQPVSCTGVGGADILVLIYSDTATVS